MAAKPGSLSLRRWCGWFVLSSLALSALVAAAGFTLLLLLHGPAEGLARAGRDLRRLSLTGEQVDAASSAVRFNRLYAKVIAPDASPNQIRSYFRRRIASGEPVILDSVITDYAISRYGRIDARLLPTGVYVGARALGPDEPPLAYVTQYPGHLILYVRHGYVLVVPPPRGGRFPPARAFSASTARKLLRSREAARELYAEEFRYEPGAYDFPRLGQSVHDLHPVTLDPATVERALAGLRSTVAAVKEAQLPYSPLRQNSNTVVGCLLRSSGVPPEGFERLREAWIFRARLPGIGVPLWPERSSAGSCALATRRPERSSVQG